MLGAGIYVSRSIEKAAAYGDTVLKLLVYPGHTCKINRQGHPLQKTWHGDYSSAWVPPDCGMVDSGLEENFIKSTDQIKVVGTLGYWDWGFEPAYNQVDLDDFLESKGLRYSKLYNRTEGVYLYAANGTVRTTKDKYRTSDCFFWTRSWDGCIENKQTGMVLDFYDDRLSAFRHDGDRSQKWKLNKNGALVNKETNRPINYYPGDQSFAMGRWDGSYDRFEFRDALTDYETSDYASNYDSD